LQVYQEVSNATNEIQFGAPVISTRQAAASVFVRDGQTIVVGGLTDRQQQKIKTGIPILGDIPVLGHLFSTTEHISERTELYLFLTPHIVLNDADAERIREEVAKKSQLMNGIPLDSIRMIESTSPLTRPEGTVAPGGTRIPSAPANNNAPNTPNTAPSSTPAPAAPTRRSGGGE
jgi:general secretion pathway protein D